MIVAAKDRRPASEALLPQPRDRRVTFAESVTDATKDGTTQPSSAAVPYPARYVPQLMPALYGPRSAFWGLNRPQYTPIIAPMAAPTAALMGRPLPPPPAGLFAQPYTAPQHQHWMRPPPWSEAFEPIVNADVLPQAPSDERGRSVLLRAVGVGALLVALITVLIAAALTIDLEAPSALPATAAMPLSVKHVHSGGADVAAPRHTVPEQAEGTPAAMVHFTNQTRRAAHHKRRVPTAVQRDKPADSKRRLQHDTRNRTRQLPQKCGRHFFTYCHNQTSEAFYSTASHACVSAALDSARVCNRGANRFSSLGSCLSSCVHVAKGRELDRCHESTLFTACSRLDVVETWWFFDGSACTKWTFPLGNCPSQGRQVFRSRRECTMACFHPKRNDTAYAHQCDAPVAATCNTEQVKYPYFADMLLKGAARCIMVSQRTLRTRRCLIGSNHFDSIASCEQACVRL